MKKLGTGAMALIIAFICLAGTISMIELRNQNDALQIENDALKSEINSCKNVDLVPCYLCGGTVKIRPVNESFYIKCMDCGLTTNYFDSQSELIRYWNKE